MFTCRSCAVYKELGPSSFIPSSLHTQTQMRKDIDLLANRFILLKSGNPQHLSTALQLTHEEMIKSRPFYLLPERFIICRLNEAGEAVKYAARAVYYARALKQATPLQAAEEEQLMATAAGLAKHLQDLVAVRISPLPLRVEVTGAGARFSGESLPVRFLNALIVIEAVLLLQLHSLVRGRFTEPDELCAYCWGLFSERELRDALRMPESAGMSPEQFAEVVRAVREEAQSRADVMKRVGQVAGALEVQAEGPGSSGPLMMALLLVAMMGFLLYIRQ